MAWHPRYSGDALVVRFEPGNGTGYVATIIRPTAGDPPGIVDPGSSDDHALVTIASPAPLAASHAFRIDDSPLHAGYVAEKMLHRRVAPTDALAIVEIVAALTGRPLERVDETIAGRPLSDDERARLRAGLLPLGDDR